MVWKGVSLYCLALEFFGLVVVVCLTEKRVKSHGDLYTINCTENYIDIMMQYSTSLCG